MMNTSFDLDDDVDSRTRDLIIKSHQVKNANILIVGATGTGKTTFLNTLKNPKYKAEMEIKSQTQNAQLDSMLLEIDNSFNMLQIIDTPGFGDNSGRSNFELEELIIKFIKKGVVSLDLVLITIRINTRLEIGQIETLMSVLRFLGSDLRNNTAILFTHCERVSNLNRKSWYDSLSEKGSPMNKIIRYCKKGPFFTGMNTEERAVDIETYANSLRADHAKIILCAVNSIPILINSEEANESTSRFMVYESAAKDSLTLKKLLPQILEEGNRFFSLKQELLKYPSVEEVKNFMEEYKDIDSDALRTQAMEWSKLQNAVEDYIERGNKVKICAEQVRQQYYQITSSITKARDILDELTIFSPIDKKSDNEEY